MVVELPGPGKDDITRISIRPGSTTIAGARAGGVTRLHDAEGRLLTVSEPDRVLKRGFENRIIEKRRTGTLKGAFSYRTLAPAEVTLVLTAAQSAAHDVEKALADAGGPVGAAGEVRAKVHERLQGIGRWTPQRYVDDGRAFRATYAPVGILPPDQYMSVVLQATVGCHYNACTFCDFYRHRPFQVKRLDAFQRHVNEVRAFLGDGVALRKSVFLADANALLQPMERLLPVFDVIAQAFPLMPRDLQGPDRTAWRRAHPGGLDGIYSFLDTFAGAPKTAEDFSALASRGLRRVYIGAESGHAPLLEFIRKPSSPDDVRRTVCAALEGNVTVGVIVLLGAGGAAFAEGHVRDTVALLNSLPLDAGDLVYFSPLAPVAGGEYERNADARGIEAMTYEEMVAQEDAMRAELRLSPAVKFARYRVEEFIY